MKRLLLAVTCAATAIAVASGSAQAGRCCGPEWDTWPRDEFDWAEHDLNRDIDSFESEVRQNRMLRKLDSIEWQLELLRSQRR